MLWITMTTNSGFQCMECGKKFKTIKAAEKAHSVGCPKCGGVDIDLESPAAYDTSWLAPAGAAKGIVQ